MIQKVAFEKMIDLNIKEIIFAIKIINLDVEVSAVKAIVAEGLIIFVV